MKVFSALSAFVCLFASTPNNGKTTSRPFFHGALGVLSMLAVLTMPSSAWAQSTDDAMPNSPNSLQPVVRALPIGVPAGYVVTPSGYFHPSCVKQLAKGETLEANGRVIRHADGALENILACNYPHYNAKGEVIDVGSSEENPLPTSHSWIEDVNVVSPTSYGDRKSTRLNSSH